MVQGDSCLLTPNLADGTDKEIWITLLDGSLIPIAAPAQYQIEKVATVSKSSDTSSKKVAELKSGTTVMVIEQRSVNGHKRARIGDDRWISIESNVTVLAPLAPAGDTATSPNTFVREVEGTDQFLDIIKDSPPMLTKNHVRVYRSLYTTNLLSLVALDLSMELYSVQVRPILS